MSANRSSMAMGSLWSNKLRTFLTLLGIIIGVLTIIAVVSVIQGLNNYVYTKMSFYGANDFSVSKFSMIGMSLKEFKEQMKRKDITLDEMYLLREKCTNLRSDRRQHQHEPDGQIRQPEIKNARSGASPISTISSAP